MFTSFLFYIYFKDALTFSSSLESMISSAGADGHPLTSSMVSSAGADGHPLTSSTSSSHFVSAPKSSFSVNDDSLRILVRDAIKAESPLGKCM